MENNELEQVQEVVEVVETTGANTLIKVGVGVGITATIVGLGILVFRKVKSKKMATIDTVEYSEVESEEETEE